MTTWIWCLERRRLKNRQWQWTVAAQRCPSMDKDEQRRIRLLPYTYIDVRQSPSMGSAEQWRSARRLVKNGNDANFS